MPAQADKASSSRRKPINLVISAQTNQSRHSGAIQSNFAIPAQSNQISSFRRKPEPSAFNGCNKVAGSRIAASRRPE
ncbi:MAG TPA: hypothetical protein VFL63_13305 [Rhodanobacteraceae bacterium]|nr:hypothetical protein [Rhodanobacteraceae bacterium]